MARSIERSPGFIKVLFPLFTLIILSIIYNFRSLLDLQSYADLIQDKYDASFGVPVSGGGLKGSSAASSKKAIEKERVMMKWEHMEQVHRPDHGTFFFGPTSEDIEIPEEFIWDPSDEWWVLYFDGADEIQLNCSAKYLCAPFIDHIS